MRQFEIWWADFREPAGRRPVLLLSRDDAYHYLSKFVAAEITSNVRQIASEVPLGDEEVLPKARVANCDNLRMVAKLSLTKRAGQLPRHVGSKLNERWAQPSPRSRLAHHLFQLEIACPAHRNLCAI
jgi:mRNA interferase MazF